MFLGIHLDEECEMRDCSLSDDVDALPAGSPNKKGLSKYYDGKSQSFTSISEMTCVHDLAKKQTSYRSLKSDKISAGWLYDMTQLVVVQELCSRPPQIPMQKNS